MDPEIGRDLLERDTRLAVTGDPHDILAELLGKGLRHSDILPARPTGKPYSDVTYPCSRPHRFREVAMPATDSGGKGGGRRRPGDYQLADTTLDGTLDEWPLEPPRAPRTAVEAARLALIQSPGTIHQLAWKLNDVGRASRIAGAFRRAIAGDARSVGDWAVRGPGCSSTRRRRSGGWPPVYVPGGDDSGRKW